VSTSNNAEDMTQDILKPSKGLQYDSPVTLKIQLTPTARISQIHFSLQTENAKSVSFTTDNPNVYENMVRIVIQ
jgi:hypothetical protein